jgi:hypothetical protein
MDNPDFSKMTIAEITKLFSNSMAAVELAKAEAEVAKAEAELAKEREEKMKIRFNQANFLNLLESEFASRTQFIDAAEAACFGVPILSEKTARTAECVNDSQKSCYSQTGSIDMSKVHRRHLAHGKDKMNVRYIKFKNLLGRAKRHKLSLGNVVDFDAFFLAECAHVHTFRESLNWLCINASGYNESALQKAYILYIKGLLEAMGESVDIFSVNGVPLETTIEVKRKGGGILNVPVKGRADCAFGPSSILAPMELSEMLASVLVLVELKVNDGLLAGSNSSVGKCTSQQLVEMLALANMKKSQGFAFQVIRSILTDFFNIRVSIRAELDGKPLSYFVSSLHTDVESFVLLTIVLLSPIDIDEIGSLVDSEEGIFLIDNEGNDDSEDDEFHSVDDDEDHCGGGKNLSTTFAEAEIESSLDKSSSFGGGAKNEGSRRALNPLSLHTSNIMSIGDDPNEEAKLKAYQKLAAWEVSLSFRDTENVPTSR